MEIVPLIHDGSSILDGNFKPGKEVTPWGDQLQHNCAHRVLFRGYRLASQPHSVYTAERQVSSVPGLTQKWEASLYMSHAT